MLNFGFLDIGISENSNKNESSSCHFPNAYGKNEVPEDKHEGYPRLTGAKSFKTKEIEVYEVIFI